MGVMRNAYKILFGNPEEKTQVGRLGYRGNTVLKWILDKGCDGVDQIQPAQVKLY
jgi:hypothetical protein